MVDDKSVTIKCSNGETVKLGNVEDYIVSKEKWTVRIVIGGKNQFFNLDHVVYVIMSCHLEND